MVTAFSSRGVSERNLVKELLLKIRYCVVVGSIYVAVLKSRPYYMYMLGTYIKGFLNVGL